MTCKGSDQTAPMVYVPLVISYLFQIWCAAGVDLTGGKTKDGGSIVGASVFYENPPESEINKKGDGKDDVEKLDDELQVIYCTFLHGNLLRKTV